MCSRRLFQLQQGILADKSNIPIETPIGPGISRWDSFDIHRLCPPTPGEPTLKHYPWFWITFSVWLLLGVAGFCRALLWGPPGVALKNSGHFRCYLNGAEIKASTWATTGTAEETADLLETQWFQEGWTPVGGGVDFFPLLLGSVNLDVEIHEVLRRCAQIRIFKRAGFFRVLGVARKNTEGSLAGIDLEMPESVLVPSSDGSDDLRLPDLPPPGTSSFALSFGIFHANLWRFTPKTDKRNQVVNWCKRNSFQLKPLRRETPDEWFTASRSGRQWLLGFLNGAEQGTCVWLSFPDRTHP